MPTGTSVEIYTKPTCGYCHMAKELLRMKSASFAETDITTRPDRRAEMIERAAGRSTVPQIFIGGAHIGGCDDLFALERSGKLDAMLAG